MFLEQSELNLPAFFESKDLIELNEKEKKDFGCKEFMVDLLLV